MTENRVVYRRIDGSPTTAEDPFGFAFAEPAATIGGVQRPTRDGDGSIDLATFITTRDPELVELVASRLHESFRRKFPPPSTQGVTLFDLKPWDELPEEIREANRAVVREVFGIEEEKPDPVVNPRCGSCDYVRPNRGCPNCGAVADLEAVKRRITVTVEDLGRGIRPWEAIAESAAVSLFRRAFAADRDEAIARARKDLETELERRYG